jgi:phosphoglucosamine mutase
VPYRGEKPLGNPEVKKAIESARDDLNGSGRLVVRASGIEPVIRIMAEADDVEPVERAVGQIVASMEALRT